MERPGYERFALVSNPFHDLASESLDEIETYHVTLGQDQPFEAVKQEVLERQRKAFVFIVGPLGAGKTQRLKLTEAQAKRVGAFHAYVHLGDRPAEPLALLAGAIADAAAAGRKRTFTSPRWLRELNGLRKAKAMGDHEGQVLAEALNALAPAFLLLNDFDALPAAEARSLLQALQSLASHIQPGVMVAVTCQAPAFRILQERLPALVSRVNRVFEAAPFSVEDARLLVAKRMAGRRLIDDLDPLYPFSDAAIAEMVRASDGSPRRLLQLADVVLEQASRDRAYQVGPEAVQAAAAKARPHAAAPEETPKPGPAARPEAPPPAAEPAARQEPQPDPQPGAEAEAEVEAEANPDPEPPAPTPREASLPPAAVPPADPAAAAPVVAEPDPKPRRRAPARRAPKASAAR